MDASVARMWAAYRVKSRMSPASPPPPAWHFCDNESDANTCAALVLSGHKRATTPSLWFLESRGLAVPVGGDLDIVANWDGVAQCVIRTTDVAIVPFEAVTAAYAAAEGEGDGSLESWRAVHWAYYERELAGTGFLRTEDMPVVCQRFEMVYP